MSTQKDYPQFIEVKSEVKVDFTVGGLNMSWVGYNNQHVMFSIKSGVCQILILSGNGHWSTVGTYPIRAGETGLQVYNSSMWKHFPDNVQEAYAQYCLENEALK